MILAGCLANGTPVHATVPSSMLDRAFMYHSLNSTPPRHETTGEPIKWGAVLKVRKLIEFSSNPRTNSFPLTHNRMKTSQPTRPLPSRSIISSSNSTRPRLSFADSVVKFVSTDTKHSVTSTNEGSKSSWRSQLAQFDSRIPTLCQPFAFPSFSSISFSSISFPVIP